MEGVILSRSAGKGARTTRIRGNGGGKHATKYGEG